MRRSGTSPTACARRPPRNPSTRTAPTSAASASRTRGACARCSWAARTASISIPPSWTGAARPSRSSTTATKRATNTRRTSRASSTPAGSSSAAPCGSRAGSCLGSRAGTSPGRSTPMAPGMRSPRTVLTSPARPSPSRREARPRPAAPAVDLAPRASLTSPPCSTPNSTRSSPTPPRASWGCGAARAVARPRWPSIASPGSSTTILVATTRRGPSSWSGAGRSATMSPTSCPSWASGARVETRGTPRASSPSSPGRRGPTTCARASSAVCPEAIGAPRRPRS
jgi:hypothetical protein